MHKIRLLLGCFIILVVLDSALAPLNALQTSSQATAASGNLLMIGSPTVAISPLCNPSGSGKEWIKIRSAGQPASKPVSVYLQTTGVNGKPPAKSPTATITAVPVSGPGGDQVSSRQTLAPGDELWVKIEVSQLYQAGDWETTLQNDGVNIGAVKIVREELPFNISLDVPNPEAPELTLQKGKPAHFGIKNGDNQDYSVVWEYDVDGVAARSSDPPGGWRRSKDRPQAAVPQNGGTVIVPANGLKEIVFWPPRKWFGGWFTGLFKDQASEERLLISRMNDQACPAATPGLDTPLSMKVFKVKTHLATSAGNSREFWADLFVFLFLLAGGLFSVTLNFMLPNHRRKSKLKGRVSDLGARISNLSSHLASRVRVLVGLEQGLLVRRLKQLSWTNTDFLTELGSIDQAATRLETRVQIAEWIGAKRDQFEELCSCQLRPSRIVAMEAEFEKIIAIAKKSDPSDADVQSAKERIQKLADEFDAAGKEDESVALDLEKRALEAHDAFSDMGSIGRTATWKRISCLLCEATAIIPDAIRKHLPPKQNGPAEKNATSGEAAKEVTATAKDPAKSNIPAGKDAPTTDIAPHDYVKVDRALFQLDLAKAYVHKFDCLKQDDPLRAKILRHETEFLDLLRNDNGHAGYLASRMLLQILQGRFREDIQEAVEGGQFRITQGRFQIEPYAPCDFTLELLEGALNSATAREDWICQWEFTHPLEETLKEEGWQVTHYFQRGDPYDFTVTLIPRPRHAEKPAQDKKEEAHEKLKHGEPHGEGKGTEQNGEVATAGTASRSLQVRDPAFQNLTHTRQRKTDTTPRTESDQKQKLPGAKMVLKVLPEKRGRFLTVAWRTFFGEDRQNWLEWKKSRRATRWPWGAFRFLSTQWRQSKTGTSRFSDGLNFILALFIVLVGMIAGAKEQLLKLDLVPALIAIFLAGFGADHVKNLLTQQTDGASTSKSDNARKGGSDSKNSSP
jgi:hypothetical protein